MGNRSLAAVQKDLWPAITLSGKRSRIADTSIRVGSVARGITRSAAYVPQMRVPQVHRICVRVTAQVNTPETERHYFDQFAHIAEYESSWSPMDERVALNATVASITSGSPTR